jgi:hypothetical protein
MQDRPYGLRRIHPFHALGSITRETRRLVKGHRVGELGLPPSRLARVRGTLPHFGRGMVIGPRGC